MTTNPMIDSRIDELDLLRVTVVFLFFHLPVLSFISTYHKATKTIHKNRLLKHGLSISFDPSLVPSAQKYVSIRSERAFAKKQDLKNTITCHGCIHSIVKIHPNSKQNVHKHIICSQIWRLFV